MSVSEAIVKVIFWPRIRKAKKIGEAAELIGQGRGEETLKLLHKMERRIPPYLGHLFFLTRGRALDELGYTDDAEKSYLAAVFAKEGATIAHIHLAVLCGKERRFQESRDWLRRIREDKEADEKILAQATELEEMLDVVESGARLKEIQERSRAFAARQDLDELSLEDALSRLEKWITDQPEQASTSCDELACLLGERMVGELGGAWTVSLSLEDSCIESDGQCAFRPFEVVRARLADEGSLEELVKKALENDKPYEPSAPSGSSST